MPVIVVLLVRHVRQDATVVINVKERALHVINVLFVMSVTVVRALVIPVIVVLADAIGVKLAINVM